VKQPKTTTSGVATPFPLVDPARAGELLSACLQGVETMFRHLQRTPLSGRLQKLLQSKFSGILKQLFGTDDVIPPLWRELPLRKTRTLETGLRVAEQGSTAERQALLGHTLLDGGSRITPRPDWAPLIKAAAPAAVSPPAYLSACAERQGGRCDGSDLAGRCVLCVGGRAALYPEYRCMVETAGGRLLIYRGDQQGDTYRLPELLARADALLCPVDCVNHDDYFAVKRYCKHSGKPCALLARSNLPTFRKGIETLSALATTPTEIPFSNQRQINPVLTLVIRGSNDHL
jgi:hypothetical protein